MVSKNASYQSINMNDNTILDDDYEPVIINEQEENYTGEITQNINNRVVHEVFPYGMNQANNYWNHDAIRSLIYYWSKFKDQFKGCNDKNKKNRWPLISEHMNEKGFYFDALSCEIKWSELKKLYMYNKRQINKRDGTKPIVVWGHYFDMDRAVKGFSSDVVDDDGDDDNSLKDENCNKTTVNHSNNTSYIINEDKCQWTVDATLELIRLYNKNRNKFLAVNQGGKHRLWEEISQQLSRLGHRYSANVCNDKWRNLKMTYKINKQREMKHGIQQVKWFFFKDMDNIFSSLKCEELKFQEFNDVINVSSLIESHELDNMKNDDDDDDTNEDFQVLDENIVINNNCEENLGTLETWTEEATKCLIELWGIYRPRFLMAPQGKKRSLWNEISEQLRQKGHNYSGLVCDRKWRLLKANYLKRKEKYKKLGVNNVKWQYYHDLDRLLGAPIETSWNMESTMCLIDTFDHYKDKFIKAATGEKHLIWKQISEELAQHGFNFSPRACDNKWRTLKNRYNKNRIRSIGNKQVVWVYYEKIDKVLKVFNKEKNPVNGEASSNNISNQTKEDVELDEHNYIKTSKEDSSIKKEAIDELKDMINLRNIEFDKKFKQIEDDLNRREKMFQDFHQQTSDALKKFYEIEVHKMKMLEKLVSTAVHQSELNL